MVKKFEQHIMNKIGNDLYSYIPVDKTLLHLNENLEFNLFTKDTQTNMSLFLQSDTIIDRYQKKKISHIEQLYISDNDKEKYDYFLEKLRFSFTR